MSISIEPLQGDYTGALMIALKMLSQNAYLDRVVECFKHSNALGTELKANASFHRQNDSIVAKLTLAIDDNNPSHNLLRTKNYYRLYNIPICK